MFENFAEKVQSMVFCTLYTACFCVCADNRHMPHSHFFKKRKGRKRKQQKRGKRGGVAIEMAKRLLPASIPKGEKTGNGGVLCGDGGGRKSH